MTTAICSMDGCERPRWARGWCGTHYLRWWHHGEPTNPPTQLEKWIARIVLPDDPTECWLWPGATDRRGYGLVKRDTHRLSAHRYIWEAHHGPVPEGLILDHLCCNPPCVNPAHLEPVTPQVNSLRGQRRLVCRRGHLISGLNIKTRRDGKRECRECVNMLWRERYWRTRAS